MLGNDLTKGPITKTLLRFTAPFLLANLLQTLYGIVDMFVVGRFADSTQLSAVSIGSLLMMMINFAVMGLGTGGTVLVGQMVGAKRDKDMKETIATVFCVLPVAAVLLMIIFMFLRRPVLELIQTPPEAMEGAEAYFRICLIGLFFTGMYTAIASVLRGMGESKMPTVFVTISCVLNIIGDIICVGPLKMGAAGAALATTVAQGMSVVIGYFYLKRSKFPFDFKPSSFRINKNRAIDLLRIGIPAACQETLVSLSFVVLEALINRMGYIATAAAGVDDRIFSIACMPAMAFSAAISAMVAQNTGAGKPERSHKCVAVGSVLSFAVSIVAFGIMGVFPHVIIGFFSPDPLVVEAGVEYMTFCKYEYLVCAIGFCVNGYINGIGRTRFTMLSNILSSIVIRLPLVYFLSILPGATLYEIGFALPVASGVQMLCGLLFMAFAKSERQYRKMRKA